MGFLEQMVEFLERSADETGLRPWEPLRREAWKAALFRRKADLEAVGAMLGSAEGVWRVHPDGTLRTVLSGWVWIARPDDLDDRGHVRPGVVLSRRPDLIGGDEVDPQVVGPYQSLPAALATAEALARSIAPPPSRDWGPLPFQRHSAEFP